MTKPPSPRPLSIKVIATWQALATIYWAVGGLVYPEGDARILGYWWLLGADAKLYIAGMVILWFWAAVGLWRLSTTGYRLSVVLYAWLLANNAVNAIYFFTVRDSHHFLFPSWQQLSFVHASIAVFAGVVLVVLLTRKAAFRKRG